MARNDWRYGGGGQRRGRYGEDFQRYDEEFGGYGGMQYGRWDALGPTRDAVESGRRRMGGYPYGGYGESGGRGYQGGYGSPGGYGGFRGGQGGYGGQGGPGHWGGYGGSAARGYGGAGSQFGGAGSQGRGGYGGGGGFGEGGGYRGPARGGIYADGGTGAGIGRGEYGGAYPGFGGYPGGPARGEYYGGGGYGAGRPSQGRGGRGEQGGYAREPFIPEEAYRRHPEYNRPPRTHDWEAHQDAGDEDWSDDEIREAVRSRMQGDAWLDPDRIEVQVEDGVVTLTGEVDDFLEARYAWDDAWETGGVVGVVNNLTVRTDQPVEPHGDVVAQSSGTPPDLDPGGATLWQDPGTGAESPPAEG